MTADIAVFDPKAVRDMATYSDPLHDLLGVKYVFVNSCPWS
jgi:N-acyl-D-aspartate/D-glutamate deacylase